MSPAPVKNDDPTRSGLRTPVESTGLQAPEIVVPSAGESHLQDGLSLVNEVQRERGISLAFAA